MTSLDAATLQHFLELAGERLEGDWVVIGGCVLPLLGVSHRVTVDIDVAGPDEADMTQMRVLMEIAEELGLSPTAINQAGSFFLRAVEGWQEHLVVLHRGAGATLHVPDATLFLLLKLRRLSETDLDDCLAMIEHVRARGVDLESDRIRAAIREHLEASPPPERRARLDALLRDL